uniref:Uncharacterized protein n=1 Tax=Meloidogyne enterolobii TaxID=390850 RepID=A0A6V7XDS8_MELEN|nr:unnamed protein product [Meloidogyne enterolobii]
MKFKNLLIFSIVTFSFFEFSSIKSVDPSKSVVKGKVESTSHDDHKMCKCGKFSLERLTETVELTGIDGNKMNLKYTTEFSAKIGAGAYSNWENDEKFFLAIELEEDNLRNYYGKIHRGKRKERSNVKVLNKIIKGAAKALAQFHKFGGHGDVKQENFVVSRDQDSNADVINVKLIDFNLSVLYGHDHDVNGIQKYDIKDFGNMVYRLLNDHYNKAIPTLHEINFDNNSKLDRIIKACFQDESIRPIMKEIVDFLNEEIHVFKYEETHKQIENKNPRHHHEQHIKRPRHEDEQLNKRNKQNDDSKYPEAV